MRPAERRARRALAALVLLPVLVFVPRVLLGRTAEPASPRPAWVKLLVVTAGSWPGAADPARPALARLERRSARIQRAWSPSDDPRAAAFGLWTGRWPSSRDPDESARQAVAAGWSLFEAARRAGVRTAAFDRAAGADAAPDDGTVLGFGGLDAGSRGDDPAADAAAFVRRARDERWLVWVHLPEAGPGGARVDAALAALGLALDETGQRHDTLTVVTALARPGARLEDRCRVPLWVELPSALHAGRRGRGGASLVDLAGLLLELLRWPGPDPDTEPPVASRPGLGTALKGGTFAPWQLFAGADGEHVLIDGGVRATWHGPDDGEPAVEWVAGGALPAGARAGAVARARAVLDGVRAGESVP